VFCYSTVWRINAFTCFVVFESAHYSDGFGTNQRWTCFYNKTQISKILKFAMLNLLLKHCPIREDQLPLLHKTSSFPSN
jgi:hypothetical protein